MPESQNPWDRRRDEPKEAYARFLIYRNLGPARSLDRAYEVYLAMSGQETKGLERPGSWARDSVAHQWANRATDWDGEVLRTIGVRSIARFLGIVDEACRRTLAALQDEKLRPANWAEILQAIEMLGQFFITTALERAVDRPQSPDRAKILPGPKSASEKSS